MSIEQPRDLLLHELGDLLYAEKTLLKAMPKMQEEVSNTQLAERIGQHIEETKEHCANIEAAFKALGEQPKAEKCPGIEGIKKEHDEFLKEDPSQEVLDTFVIGSAMRAEHYEIAAYTATIELCNQLGEDEAGALLQKNLDSEYAMLQDAERMAQQPVGA